MLQGLWAYVSGDDSSAASTPLTAPNVSSADGMKRSFASSPNLPTVAAGVAGAVPRSARVSTTDDNHLCAAPVFEMLPPDLVQLAGQGGFAHNIKIVIRGAARTGKTSLLNRLQGKPLAPAYTPTLAINTATIRWADVAREMRSATTVVEVIKVEVWDVVDVGAAMPPGHSTSKYVQDVPQIPCLPVDATTVNVYSGCHCAIFMVDVTRRETYTYVEHGLRLVPPNVVVIICANFMDAVQDFVTPGGAVSIESTLAALGASSSPLAPLRTRVVSDADLARLCSERLGARTAFMGSATDGRPSPAFQCEAAVVHTSMRSGVGLRGLHKLIACPVAMVQISAVERHLAELYGRMAAARAEAVRMDLEVAGAPMASSQAVAKAKGVAVASHEQLTSSDDEDAPIPVAPPASSSSLPRVAGDIVLNGAASAAATAPDDVATYVALPSKGDVLASVEERLARRVANSVTGVDDANAKRLNDFFGPDDGDDSAEPQTAPLDAVATAAVKEEATVPRATAKSD